MKTYKITTEHNVFIDNYENGEGKSVNFYILTSECKALTVQDAIINHFNNTVYLPFDIQYADIDKEQNLIFYCNLVNVDNEDPTEHELEEWKKGKIELYSNHIVISAQELTKVIF
jgi:hypothetical protein